MRVRGRARPGPRRGAGGLGGLADADEGGHGDEGEPAGLGEGVGQDAHDVDEERGGPPLGGVLVPADGEGLRRAYLGFGGRSVTSCGLLVWVCVHGRTHRQALEQAAVQEDGEEEDEEAVQEVVRGGGGVVLPRQR